MTDEELAAIRARAEAATAGPWEWLGDSDLHAVTVYEYEPDEEARHDPTHLEYATEKIIITDSGCYPPEGADAEFIAHAREDIPRLLAEIARLRTMLDAHYETKELLDHLEY